MNDSSTPWTVSSMSEAYGLKTEKFATLTEALSSIARDEALDPEDQGFACVEYEAPADFMAVEGDYALVYGRIVCKVVNGWAGGVANYKLQLAGQWTRNEDGKSVTGEPADGTRFMEMPIEFWTPEGSASEPKNFPAPGARSDLILFSRDHL